MAPKKPTARFASQSRTVLAGSEKAPAAPSVAESPAPLANKLTASVIVRRKKPLKAAHASGKQRLTRAQFRASHAADPAAVKSVRAFAKEFSLTVQPGTPAPGRRTIKLTGSVANMQRAFGVALMNKALDGTTYRVREGSITLPSELTDYVVAVLGLDNRPQALPHFRVAGDDGGLAANIAQAGGFARPHAGGNVSYTPVQVGHLYGFPAGATASNQTIGLIELGGAIGGRGLDHRWLLGLTGIVSLLFGVLMLANPVAGTLAVVWIVGVYAVVFGVMLVVVGVRALGGHHDRPEVGGTRRYAT